MIDKIFQTEDIIRLEKELPDRLSEYIKTIIKKLNNNYGVDRKLTDDGGHICIPKSIEEVKELKENVLKGLIEEYSDVIYTSDNEIYNSTLYLLSTDYSVVVITKNKITDELLK
ncbi:hypothetical protein [Metaclostridioides mangenotii]|uniref:hypothetical protein n=1 Tax=Metaclostridioides mangenotii TaxID=1540 RepID=UPI0004649949|nr:hypothetical protein [Clostridioides mangenotii]